MEKIDPRGGDTGGKSDKAGNRNIN